MASEKRPVKKATGTITVGRGKSWERKLSLEDMRVAEGTVDENGVRTIEYVKDDNGAYNRATIKRYKDMGYTLTDHGDYVEFSISDTEYRKIEKAIQDKGLYQVRDKSADGEFSVSRLESAVADFETMADILGDDE